MRRIHSTARRAILFIFASLTLLIPFLFQVVGVQTSSEPVVRIEPYTSYANVGERFAINITVDNIQNLYGIEITLAWNASILHVVSVDLRLGAESHPDGVLHEPPPVFIAKNNVTQERGEYLLAATSVAPAPSFNGTGNIARITFDVVSHGDSKLNLETQLYDYPPPDREPRISLPIEHITIDGFFEIIPEFPITTMLLVLFMISTIVAVAFSKSYLRRFLSITI